MVEKIANKIPKGSKKKILETLIEEIDDEDFLKAFDGEEELHMDYAHSISIGYNKERYYLIFVVGGVNFMWATPTTTLMLPEDLLRDFMATSGIKIGKVQVDGAFETTSFKAFCKRNNIEITYICHRKQRTRTDITTTQQQP